MKHKATIGVLTLSLMVTGAIDGISDLPSIALFGQQLVFFFILGAIIFLLPAGLISAELCTQFKEESGIYYWSKQAFGPCTGTLAAWLQWINTMVWFPTALSALTGTLAFLLVPSLVHNPVYLVASSLLVFWLMTLANMKGIKQASRIAAIAIGLGTIIPMCLVIGMVFLWVILGKPLALHLNETAILPSLNHTATWASLTAIVTSFLGMELATVHVKKIHNAHKIFPQALIIAIMIIICTMGIGSIGVALVIPHQSIVLTTGTIQTFHKLFTTFHIHWMEKVAGFLLVMGSAGAMVNWLISPANSLAHAAKDGFLPKALAEDNKYHMPANILLMQGAVVTLASMSFFLMPSINGSYWLLIDLSTELYVMMYLLMFAASFKHLWRATKIHVIPGGKTSAIILNILGILASVITLVIGFFPPSQIDVGSTTHFVLLFAGGLIIMACPSILLMAYKKYLNKPSLTY